MEKNTSKSSALPCKSCIKFNKEVDRRLSTDDSIFESAHIMKDYVEKCLETCEVLRHGDNDCKEQK